MAAPAVEKKVKPIPLPMQMVLSGAAASWGEFCTIPFDTAKVRLQIQDKLPAAGAATTQTRYRGLIHCLTTIVKEEGFRAPWKGVIAGLQRQCAFAPIRIGLYQPVRDIYCGKEFSGNPSILQKIAAGLTTSAIGISVASPADVVKVRLQAEGRLAPNVPRRYNGVIDAYSKIIKAEGIAGLWTGYGPNLVRNCVVNATELVAYDQTKQMLLGSMKLKDDAGTHILSGLSAGLCATLLGSPVDVIKTRVMNAKKDPVTGTAEFKGPVDCAIKLMRKEGPFAFYKGFIPNFSRIGSWNIVAWTTLEFLRGQYNKHRSD
jgi:solute carrier family 25 uncoupling protein 8/9